MPLLVMISGWARVGKDAAASLMTDEMGFRRLAFADALKEIVSAETGLPIETFHLATKDAPLEHPCKSYPTAKTPRDLLLQHALVARAKNPDVYAALVGEKMIDCGTPLSRIVISDWRYKREYDYLRREFPEYQILRLRINRQGVSASADLSEHDLDDEPMNVTIQNDGGISDLRDLLRAGLRTALHR
jgi:hypothetical protein